jgi:hypothetical protein
MTDKYDTETPTTTRINKSELLELCERYENIRKQKRPDVGTEVTYWIKDKIGNDAGSVSFGKTRMCVYLDNFPGQKKFYRSEIPIETLEELENDLKRCGLKLRANKKVNENLQNKNQDALATELARMVRYYEGGETRPEALAKINDAKEAISNAGY